jgi:O-antigen ligase
VAVAAAVVRFVLPEFWANYWFRLSGSIRFLFFMPNRVLSGRVTNWQALTDFLAAHPWHLLFGIGYKTIPYTDYVGASVVGDNTYLSLLVETGAIGLIAFALLNWAILRTALHAARSGAIRASFFGTWIFCFWCGELVQMLTGDLITYWRVLPVYFWVLATAAREAGD